MKQQAFEGTGEELQEHLKRHPHARFRLVLLSTENDEQGESSEPSRERGLRRGMFPQLQGLTEEDFKAAEWRGDESDC